MPSTPTVVGPFVKATASDGGRAVRDSKNQHGPRLHFGPAQWTAFTDSVKGRAHQG
ncbi:DUF397 domain-containing protein [Streptomyces griseus]|uniref:DUF397 domain-containing protein n=1 Tax=Streptomyces griseus TaxID=1911 RepID=UPI000997928A|nr:DUF397 domain-containing protein [Streptomyces griseus]